ncbi:MAG TPA: GNAT family N-acetyltransferase [Rhizomicrobium sp.]|nr:GNAT family N-acetyltransferase [Rhizomicrobium sp.]
MEITIRVAATPDDITKVFALRAAVFMSEQNCPYDEEFDGNDYCSTHLLGLVGAEPAAVLRLRFFAEFAHVGRLAVLPRFRRTRIHSAIIKDGIELCRRKGYRTLYGHSQKRLVNFWSRFGFKPMRKNSNLVFSDHEYVEMQAELPPHSAAITTASDPYVILRPEGKWDEPGVLDQSAQRSPTNPY